MNQTYIAEGGVAGWGYEGLFKNSTVLQGNLTMRVYNYPTIPEARTGYDIMGGNDHDPRLPDNLPMGDQGLFRERRGYDPYTTGTEFVRWVGSYYMVRVSNVLLTLEFNYERDQNSTAPMFNEPWMREMVASQVANLKSFLT